MERRLDPGRASRADRRARRDGTVASSRGPVALARRLAAFVHAPKPGSLALALTLAVTVVGCSSIGIGEEPILTSAAPTVTVPSAPIVPPGDRARSQEHIKLVGTYGGVYENEKVELAVASVVGRLLAASDQPNRSFRVTILNSPAVNAFALPSGDLYVTRGLLALANDESELAAVIAHEIAHVTADHATLRQRQAQAAALARRVSEVVADPALKAGSREQAELSLAAFSQGQELEADKIGVKTLYGAGFDPFAASRFLGSMARFAALPSLNAMTADKPGFLSSHPTTPARVEQAKAVAREYGGPGIGSSKRTTYVRSLDGLLYGDDPREGYVRGREFAHIELGIAFTVPEGYVLKNTSSAVLATDGEHTAIRFDEVTVSGGTDLADYLRSGWVKGLVDDSIRTDMVDGLEVALASALVEGWSFRIGLVRGPRQVYRFIFASSQPASAYEDAFRRTLASFRLLSPSQKAAMRPLRVRILEVKAGDTVATLSGRMAGVDEALRLPLFETLNGLGEDRALLPGELVKIVTE